MEILRVCRAGSRVSPASCGKSPIPSGDKGSAVDRKAFSRTRTGPPTSGTDGKAQVSGFGAPDRW